MRDYTLKEFNDLLKRHGFDPEYSKTGSILLHPDAPGREFIMQKPGESKRDALNRLLSEMSI